MKESAMWQIICLCLPTVAKSEQLRFFTSLSDMRSASGGGLEEIDIGLFFLPSLTPEEALTVLEERRDLVVRSQQMLPGTPVATDVLRIAIDDHIRTLLAAELEWLERTLAQLQDLNSLNTPGLTIDRWKALS